MSGVLSGRGLITQVHFGRGSAEFFTTSDMTSVIDAVESGFGITDDTPIGIEIDPNVSQSVELEQLICAGISRANVLLDDFRSESGKDDTRGPTFTEVEGYINLLRDQNVNDVCISLTYGKPTQTLSSFRDTFRKVMILSPDRISLSPFCFSDRLQTDRRTPNKETRMLLAEEAHRTLMSFGYLPVGFDQYARPETALARAARSGQLNRNFQGYTEDPATCVIGLGAAALTALPGVQVQNHTDVEEYCSAIHAYGFACACGAAYGHEEGDLGDWLRRLLCESRGDLRRYRRILALDQAGWSPVEQRVLSLIEDGVAALDGDELVIFDEAKPLLRSVASLFDPSVQPIGKAALSP
ncbi:MAG: hypothetical protein AAGH41_07655 [Pseudomonadota bacterium]